MNEYLDKLPGPLSALAYEFETLDEHGWDVPEEAAIYWGDGAALAWFGESAVTPDSTPGHLLRNRVQVGRVRMTATEYGEAQLRVESVGGETVAYFQPGFLLQFTTDRFRPPSEVPVWLSRVSADTPPALVVETEDGWLAAASLEPDTGKETVGSSFDYPSPDPEEVVDE